MNLATDFDFTTPNNAALSLKTIAELVRQEKLKCDLSAENECAILLEIINPAARRSK